MSSIDHAIAGLGGGSMLVAAFAAVLLGLRHASDPDHLTAVSMLVMSERGDGVRRATRLGLSWGAGHALALVVFGLPLVAFRSALPQAVERIAEVAVGVVIVALAVRLIIRWRRGFFHAHPHRHGDSWHSHPHAHELARAGRPAVHDHAHPGSLGRSPRAAFGIGLLHGLGGSGAVGLLLVGLVPGRMHAAIALVLFAGATAVAMALLSTAFGAILGRTAAAQRVDSLVPAFGAFSLAFGAVYALLAI